MCDNQADEVMKEHDYDSTILIHKRFLKKMPTNGLALYHLGCPYGQTGNHIKEVFYKNPSLNAPPFRAEFLIRSAYFLPPPGPLGPPGPPGPPGAPGVLLPE
jgi:hypothetical protein